jgi:predicted RNA binding protein YcfA (HicA-like mRNA interferase family)
MTKKEKLIKKFLNTPEKISFLEICKIIEWIGGEIVDGKGSHVVFKYENEVLLTIPKHNNDCKSFYKKQMLKILISKNLLK